MNTLLISERWCINSFKVGLILIFGTVTIDKKNYHPLPIRGCLISFTPPPHQRVPNFFHLPRSTYFGSPFSPTLAELYREMLTMPYCIRVPFSNISYTALLELPTEYIVIWSLPLWLPSARSGNNDHPFNRNWEHEYYE